MQLTEHIARVKDALHSWCWSHCCCRCSWAEVCLQALPSFLLMSMEALGHMVSGTVLSCGRLCSVNTWQSWHASASHAWFSACHHGCGWVTTFLQYLHWRRIPAARQGPFGQLWCFVKGSGISRCENLRPRATPPGDPLLFAASGSFSVFLTGLLVAQASTNLFCGQSRIFTGMQISLCPFPLLPNKINHARL